MKNVIVNDLMQAGGLRAPGALRATIRIVAMEVCHGGAVPERLWRGETNSSAVEFRSDHEEYFGNPGDDFEFVAYYFELT